MKRVAIIPHLGKPEVASSAKELVKWLTDRKVKVKIPRSDALALGDEKLACADEEIAQTELVVVLGGDGTILRAARLLRGTQVPVLGINMGKFGFLSEVQLSDLYSALERIIKGDHTLDQRMMIEGQVYGSGKKDAQKIIALNEIVVERGSGQRLLKLSVSINGSFFKTYSADGLIFATPTGSTAYSLSAGGPIVSPKNHLILMTPVCPHGLFDRTLVLSESDEIEISCPSGDKVQVTVSADGVALFENQPFKTLQVKASDITFPLVKVTKKAFFDTLKEKTKGLGSFK